MKKKEKETEKERVRGRGGGGGGGGDREGKLPLFPNLSMRNPAAMTTIAFLNQERKKNVLINLKNISILTFGIKFSLFLVNRHKPIYASEGPFSGFLLTEPCQRQKKELIKFKTNGIEYSQTCPQRSNKITGKIDH